MKRTPNKLRVAILAGDYGEIVALGKLVAVSEIMNLRHWDELKVAFLPDNSAPIQEARTRIEAATAEMEVVS